jgi:hypothetical protein
MWQQKQGCLDGRIKRTWHTRCEDGGKEPQAKECEQPLEAGVSEETDSQLRIH